MTAHTQSSSLPFPVSKKVASPPPYLQKKPLIRLAASETGPALLAQYAAMIACFWRDCHRRGLLVSKGTLDILDLCPRKVAASEWLVTEVERRLPAQHRARVRYLPVLMENPLVPGDQYESGGYVGDETAHLQWCGEGDPRQLYQASGNGAPAELYRPANPVVVIAHDAWSQLPQELFAMHYGKLLHANLRLLAAAGADKEQELWQVPADRALDASLNPLIDRYRIEFNSAPVVYPAGAFRFLSAATKAAEAGLLVISLDSGCTSDVALRTSSFADICSGYRQFGRLPVNFQLLGRWAGNAGGLTTEIDLHDSRVLQSMLLGPVSSVPCLDKLIGCIDPAFVSSRAQLSKVACAMVPGVGLEARLNLLQLSRHDPGVFLAGAQGIIKELARVQDRDRRPWQQALDKVWEHHQCFPADQRLASLLAQAAMHCGHWGLARSVLTDAVQRTSEPADLAHLAWCEARTGRLATGLSLVERALALEPGHVLANEVRRRLAVRSAGRDQRWLVELRHPDLPIVLEPLDDSHAEAFSHQYRDPQIAVMTGLPAMSTPDEVRKWMSDQQSDAGRVNYAVMHADWGFVGFINLAVSGASAFFCFWTGVDFQSLGFATAAGRLACRHAAGIGVPVMLTSAYKDNHRSIRALKRLGFFELSIRACPPDQDRIFFALIDPRAGKVNPDRELRDYYRRENLPMAFDTSTFTDASSHGSTGEPS